MRLVLFRHGEAESYAESDSSRQLTKSGSTDNHKVIAKLRDSLDIPREILCSPYLRAQQTATDLISAIPGLRFQEFELLVPHTKCTQLLSSLAERLEAEVAKSGLMLVGHNPLLSDLLCLLVDGQTPADRYLGTSNIVSLRLEVMAPGCAELESWFTPD
ncbi:MAG: phosphohistidine phosphatase SixA [Pseudomonadales bacterium]|nr:phosphohistidine phosphatase SixA [Pseudomonadales bacterium]